MATAISLFSFPANSISFDPLFAEEFAFTTPLLEDGFSYMYVFQSPPSPHQPFMFYDRRELKDCCWCCTNPRIIAVATSDGSVSIVDAFLREESSFCVPALVNTGSFTTSVDWNPTNDGFVSSCSEGSVNLWSVSSRIPHQRFSHSAYVSCIKWYERFPQVYCYSSFEGFLRVRDTRTREVVISMRDQDPAPLTSFDWNPNGVTRIASCSDRRENINIWDLTMPRRPMVHRPIKVLHGGHESGFSKLKFSPHREHLIACSSYHRSIVVWDYIQEEQSPVIHNYPYHDGPVWGIDFSKNFDGKIASCGKDGIRLWQHAH